MFVLPGVVVESVGPAEAGQEGVGGLVRHRLDGAGAQQPGLTNGTLTGTDSDPPSGDQRDRLTIAPIMNIMSYRAVQDHVHALLAGGFTVIALSECPPRDGSATSSPGGTGSAWRPLVANGPFDGAS